MSATWITITAVHTPPKRRLDPRTPARLSPDCTRRSVTFSAGSTSAMAAPITVNRAT